MSYDVQVWSVRGFEADALPAGPAWTEHEGGWSHERRTWVLHVERAVPALEEDLPDEVVGCLPGIAYLIELSLEPIGAPRAARQLLERTARAIARRAHGVVLDPQRGSVTLPGGVKRWLAPAATPGERCSLLTMSWWMDHARLARREGLEALLSVLETSLPEAMPRRYGAWEPPAHRYEQTGREHLLEFLVEQLNDDVLKSVVWCPQRPVQNVFLSVDGEPEWRRLGSRRWYRCNRLTLEIDAAALAEPGWELALQRAWRALSLLSEPFFGEVRTLRDHLRERGEIGKDARSEPSPTAAWWWKGVPPRLGQALVVGARYLEAWPELEPHVEHAGPLAFVDGGAWTRGEDLAERLGGVPARLALPFQPHQHTGARGGTSSVYPDVYPDVFPFGPRPADEG